MQIPCLRLYLEVPAGHCAGADCAGVALGIIEADTEAMHTEAPASEVNPVGQFAHERARSKLYVFGEQLLHDEEATLELNVPGLQSVH